MYKSRADNLNMHAFARWVARWVGPEHRPGVGEDFGMVLEPARLADKGYLLSTYRAYGGWNHWQFEALRALVERHQAVPSFDGLAFVVLRDVTGYTMPDEMLRGMYASTT